MNEHTDRKYHGKVVETSDGPRFAPDDSPERRLRLTKMKIFAGERPDGPDNEITLTDYLGSYISFSADRADETWIWQVQKNTIKRDFI